MRLRQRELQKRGIAERAIRTSPEARRANDFAIRSSSSQRELVGVEPKIHVSTMMPGLRRPAQLTEAGTSGRPSTAPAGKRIPRGRSG
jgi:hypothetical protein